MSKCFFSNEDANVTGISNRDGDKVFIQDFCKYWISNQAKTSYSNCKQLSKRERNLCLRETVLLNQQGLTPFWTIDGEEQEVEPNVVIRSIEKVRKNEVDHKLKEIHIIKLLADKLNREDSPFNYIKLNKSERYSLGIFEDYEYYVWIKSLLNQGLIAFDDKIQAEYEEGLTYPELEKEFIKTLIKSNIMTLTTSGWEKHYEQTTPIFSSNVFIAMAYTDNEGKKIDPIQRESIKTVLKSLKWNPIIIDEVEHNEGIMDKIIANINQSRFLIAELTYHKSGVYYEAGYAMGKGLPVIYLVKEDHLNKSHFDVKHLNLIVWSTEEELKERLKNRILASIGKNI